MNPLWVLRAGRLVLAPVGGADLADLRAIKADPRQFAIMLGGVRSAQQAAEELAEDVIADRKSTRLNSSHSLTSRMPSSA